MSRHSQRTSVMIECAICGFETPLDEATRHYLSRLWVDKKCNDAIGADEYRQRLIMPRENAVRSPQPVHGQGVDGVSSGFGTHPFGPWPFGDPA